MVETGGPIPDLRLPLLAKAPAFNGLDPHSFRYALVPECAPGAPPVRATTSSSWLWASRISSPDPRVGTVAPLVGYA